MVKKEALEKINAVKITSGTEFFMCEDLPLDRRGAFDRAVEYFVTSPDERAYATDDMTFFTVNGDGEQTFAYLQGVGADKKSLATLLSMVLEATLNPLGGVTSEDKLRGVLSGEHNEKSTIAFMNEQGIAGEGYVAMAIKSNFAITVEAYDYICKNFLGDKDMAVMIDPATCAIVKMTDSDLSYGAVRLVAEEIRFGVMKELGTMVWVGVGAFVSTFLYVEKSFKQALDAVNIGMNYEEECGVYPYADYLIYKILQDVPKEKLESYYLGLLSEEGMLLFEDEDMDDTVKTFFLSDLNISDASRRLYMHRNTLMYRIDKIERSTNLNVKSFSSAVAYRLLSIIKKLLAK